MMLLKLPDANFERVPETNQMDKALKQRLVGASVLIILAVVVLPMFLSGRSDTLKQESRQIELPPKPDELSIETRRFPVGIPGKPASTARPVQSAGTDKVSISGENLDSSAQQAAGIEKEPVPSATIEDQDTNESTNPETNSHANVVLKPPAVKSITLSSGRNKNVNTAQSSDGSQTTPRYLVQVASFSSEKNANALASQLQADHLPVLMDVVDRAAGPLHRVRVGPYTERSDADAVVTGLRSTMKDLSPRVLDLRPTESAPVSSPSDPLVRWVVQVGSFSSSDSAEALVAELRRAGLAAFSEKVSSANDSVYKVRIGPEIDRDRAVELARKVKAEHGLDGFVTTRE